MLNGIIQLNYFIIRRSAHIEWNYPAELFAFSARLGEQIPSKVKYQSNYLYLHIYLTIYVSI